jgi:hypothetical protein
MAGIAGIMLQVILMLWLCRPELTGLLYFCHHDSGPDS